jgi:hypothetical protein
MSDRRSIHGIWLIERDTGRNLIARAYTGVSIDMDLIAPFLSATHTFINRAANETLRTIDTDTHRYVWAANDELLFVMAVSKGARTGHMRFLLDYALNEFMHNEVPEGMDLTTLLKQWEGNPNSFERFATFMDELVSQYEQSGESLVAGKTMDSLEVYNHLFRALMEVKVDKRTRKKIVDQIKARLQPLVDAHPFLSVVPVDEAGIEVLNIDVYSVDYKALRAALESLLKTVAEIVRSVAGEEPYRNMVFDHAMPYVKNDIKRLETYAILDDVVRYLL